MVFVTKGQSCADGEDWVGIDADNCGDVGQIHGQYFDDIFNVYPMINWLGRYSRIWFQFLIGAEIRAIWWQLTANHVSVRNYPEVYDIGINMH